ncbi:MAG: NAD-dependent epimerase/dehydratase family protein [Peptostreptococcaceae bacterium]|jgi:UDP-2-acetamido-2,6-beta-L-arabino-hexul-4-ose reductase|nr:NAD-dependent epimerase/dehydratase family protein [Peptostreptococcaceae bacterium]
MRILVTGSKGFIGKNLIAELKNRGYDNILEFDKDNTLQELKTYCEDIDFVFHLAGVNRPKNESEFMVGNFDLTKNLLEILEEKNNNTPILITSSIQAIKDNPYGKSKKAGEKLVRDYSNRTGSNVFVYRLQNVFGKWCKPNYNSVIATFCNNIAKGIEITINDSNVKLNLVYIDDVINQFIKTLKNKEIKIKGFCMVDTVYEVKLETIANLIKEFKCSRLKLEVPNMSDSFTKKLYSTYLSYLKEDDFSYDLKMNVDNRGSFTEFIRTKDRGQVSVNVSKSGITKGNHWHHTKNEKFLVVSGKGVIRFRKIDSSEIIEYFVSADKMQVVDIPTGYTHNIENLGETDMVTIMWVNEPFNPEKPDTYYELV